MKKLLPILFTLISFAAFAQVLAPKSGGVALRVNDSTTYISSQASAHALGYADIFWNNQATTPHMDIWNGSTYVHVFDFNGGGAGGGVSSVSGTSNRITSTGGATPVIDISASYVGQTSITTLGTISTGTVPGTLVSNTPAGTIAATTSQAALNELDTDKEAVANKATSFAVLNNTLYPTTQAVENRVASATINPGIYLSPAQSFDPSFVVIASAIAKPGGTYVVNDPITWSILDHTTNHNSSFFTTITPSSGNLAFIINFPAVKNVLYGNILPDESFYQYGVMGAAPSISLTNMTGHARFLKSFNITLRGDGAGAWTERGTADAQTMLDLGTYSGGGSPFNLVNPAFGVNYDELQITYQGTNGYNIRRVYSGLGAYNAKFVLVNPMTGTDLATNPTTSDEVVISSSMMYTAPLDMYKWVASNQFMSLTPSFNFWIYGTFECWMVAAATSTTSIQVRWQPVYPSATTYKIYRDTQSSFATQVLIHTGTSGVYLDTGLSSNTLYYYKLVAVVSGVDTDVTTFRTNTKAF